MKFPLKSWNGKGYENRVEVHSLLLFFPFSLRKLIKNKGASGVFVVLYPSNIQIGFYICASNLSIWTRIQLIKQHMIFKCFTKKRIMESCVSKLLCIYYNYLPKRLHKPFLFRKIWMPTRISYNILNINFRINSFI